MRKPGVGGEELLNRSFQLGRIACGAERADNAGYFFLEILHGGESGLTDAETAGARKGQGMGNPIVGPRGLLYLGVNKNARPCRGVGNLFGLTNIPGRTSMVDMLSSAEVI